jgi:D-beta-D-heptose 7-phosphate kinase/D-beta-D-heptose 1-phosphate adenosyltransferase
MKKLLIVGDVMLDRYVMGAVERISPEAPVPVVRVTHEELKPGGAANVASNTAGLKMHTLLFGVIGNDQNGEALSALATSLNIDQQFVKESIPTICKIRVIGNHQQIVRFDYEEVRNTPERISALQNLLEKNDLPNVVISDYGKGVCSSELCQFLIQATNQKQGKVIVDPKGDDWFKYQGAYMITPNLKELSEIRGKSLPNEDEPIAEAGKWVRKEFNIAHLLVTRSERGMTLIDDDGAFHFPTQAQSVYDVTGAGDTVIATLVVSLASGLSLHQSIARANYAAGIAVSKFGTYAVTLDDLAAWDQAQNINNHD